MVAVVALTERRAAHIFNKDALSIGCVSALPLRSMVGQLTLNQHIGVRIPEGQPFCVSVVIRYEL